MTALAHVFDFSLDIGTRDIHDPKSFSETSACIARIFSSSGGNAIFVEEALSSR